MAELSDILLGPGLPFDVDGKTFYVRAPSPEEYDDAMSLQAAVRKRALATPEIAVMRELPASDEAARMIKEAIAETEQEIADTDDEEKTGVLKRRLDGLREVSAKRNLADEVAEERAILARDRWLTLRLLCDENSKPVVPPGKVTRDSWALLPLQVRNAARPAIWIVLGMINDLPFGWDRPQEPKSS